MGEQDVADQQGAFCVRQQPGRWGVAPGGLFSCVRPRFALPSPRARNGCIPWGDKCPLGAFQVRQNAIGCVRAGIHLMDTPKRRLPASQYCVLRSNCIRVACLALSRLIVARSFPVDQFGEFRLRSVSVGQFYPRNFAKLA